jgi:hypothetical protein
MLVVDLQSGLGMRRIDPQMRHFDLSECRARA